MNKASLFSNKVFQRTSRTDLSEQEELLILSILEKSDIETKYDYINFICSDFFCDLFLISFKDHSYIIRLSLNHGLWFQGDNLSLKASESCGIFLKEVGRGVIDNFEYSIFKSWGPRSVLEAGADDRLVFSRFMGAAEREINLVKHELPSTLEAYDDYFDLCTVSKYIPLGAERDFNKRSPMSIEDLNEFVSLVREDFIETLNNLPDPPRIVEAPCFGPLDPNYVFYDPFLIFLPPMLPHIGNPYLDIAINSNLLSFSFLEINKIYSISDKKKKELDNYIGYLTKEVWQPTIVPQLLNKFISYSFSSFPERSVIDNVRLYDAFCRNRILSSKKYKKYSKIVDSFFLNNIIY